MLIILSAYIIGIFLSAESILLSLIICAIIICIIMIINIQQKKTVIIAAFIFFMIGLAYPQYLMDKAQTKVYAHGSIISAKAVVLRVNAANTIIKIDNKKYIIFGNDELLPADIIDMTARYIDFREASNPHVFDMKKYYERKGISASLIPEQINVIGISKRIDTNIIRAAYIMQSALNKQLMKQFDKSTLGLIQGILIGYKQELDEKSKEDFRRAGLSHTMAVSGAHVAFVLMPFKFVVFRTIKRKRKRIILLMIPAITYMFITGMGVSVIRAVLMLVMLFFMDWNNKKAKSAYNIAVCAFLMLIYSPFYIYDIAFLLSFSATAGIVLVSKQIQGIKVIKKLPKIIRMGVSVTISAQLAVLPILIISFNKISLISLVTNIIFIPMVQIITVMALLCLLPGISAIISPVLNMCARIFLDGVGFFSELSFSQISFPAIGMSTVIAYYIILLMIFIPEKKEIGIINYAVLVLLVSLLFNNYSNSTTINFLSAGNGDCIYIRTNDNVSMLIDGGDNRISFGRYQLIQYLFKSGVSSIDMVFVTHSHADHMDGIYDVLDNIKIHSLMLPDVIDKERYMPLVEAALSKGTAVYYISKNDFISIGDDIAIKILNPMQHRRYGNINNESIVMRLDTNEFSILFTGDAERAVETSLRDTAGRVDLLKAGHHGSNTSSTAMFLEAVRPSICVISAGENNYGHPSPEVVNRLGNYGDVFITKYDRHLKFIIKDDIMYLDKFNE